MLFNSFNFLFAFLPVTMAGFFLLARRGSGAAVAWLAAASLFFYGWWDSRYVALLLASISFNYCCALRIQVAQRQSAKKRWLVLAVSANLLLLGYYKYANFFIASATALGATHFPALDIVLPIGISFFTFTQIAFLVDACRGKVNDYRLIHYILFVTYFPHLIAGPVLHHKQMMPQFDQARQFSRSHLAVGLSIFCIGLAKKVLLADNLAPHANSLFDGTAAPTLLLAWGGVLAYAFQLYFDFSGYSDMAIGLSRLFGIHLPLNFDSPYKATSISQFWRRWHMTLSHFLRDYLYIAIGGNRCGPLRRTLNLMVTMLLGGLWHGAGWNFAIWGCLHGLFLIIHQGWGAIARRLGLACDAIAWKMSATALTFAMVCCAWVFFRAADLATSLKILQGMSGGFGISLPAALGSHLGNLKPAFENAGVHFFLGGGGQFLANWCWVATAAFIVFSLPNTQQIMCQPEPVLAIETGAGRTAPRWIWSPSPRWAVALGLLAVAGLLSLSHPSDFLYFQF
jgi:alginate O-acetyltransferase complex protein AlgI